MPQGLTRAQCEDQLNVAVECIVRRFNRTESHLLLNKRCKKMSRAQAEELLGRAREEVGRALRHTRRYQAGLALSTYEAMLTRPDISIAQAIAIQGEIIQLLGLKHEVAGFGDSDSDAEIVDEIRRPFADPQMRKLMRKMRKRAIELKVEALDG